MNIYFYSLADLEKCSYGETDSRLFTTTSTFINSKDAISKPHQIICLDVNLHNTAETTVTVDHLRSIIDSIKFFNTSTECLENIEQTKSISTFVIVSEQQAEDFVPHIHNRENILLVYIIRQNYEFVPSNWSSEWISKYKKIKQYIYTTFEDLLEDLRKDVKGNLVSEGQCDLHIEKFGESAGCSYKSWFPELIDILCNLPYPEDQLHKLLPLLKQNTTSKNIDIFEQEYKTKGAIHYYTKETFVYVPLNQALRQHNIHLLFKFGFFIKDLYQQLKTAQQQFIQDFSDTPILTLFRGQMMPKFDINKLLDDLYIYNTTMFSSSLDRNVSLIFQDSRLKQDSFLQNVLFQIEVDLRKRSLPYAYINEHSQFKHELEILFMAGNLFKLRDIKFNEEANHYLVNLILLNDFEPTDLRISKDYCDRRNLKNSLSTLTFKMYDAVPAEQHAIYCELMNLYPSEKWIEAVKIYRYGQYLHYRTNQYQLALKEYNHALNIWLSLVEDTDLNCSIDIGHVYTLIGNCHQQLEIEEDIIKMNYDQAYLYYQTAHNNSHSEHELTETLDYLAIICAIKMELQWEDDETMRKYGSMAIDYKQQYIQRILKNELYDKLKVAESLKFLAYYCEKMKNYDVMLSSYKMALDIYQKEYEPDLTSINVCVDEIVKIYIKQKNDVHSAIPYQKIQHDNTLKYNEIQPEDEEIISDRKKKRIAESHIELAKLYVNDNQYDLAFEQIKLVNALYKDERKCYQMVAIYDIINVWSAVEMKIKSTSRRKSI